MMDIIRFVSRINQDISLRTMAKEFNVSTQTVRNYILKIDAQMPGIFKGRRMKDSLDIFSKKEYEQSLKILKSKGTIKDIEHQLQLSSAKANLISTLTKIKTKELRFIPVDIEKELKKQKISFVKKEKSIRNLPANVTPLLVFEKTVNNKMVSRKKIAESFGISMGIFRKLYKKGLKQKYPNNGNILAPFDIVQFKVDRELGLTWKKIAEKYNISIMNACQWGKKIT
jgi:predicted DNA-binding protein YlxM (UPF0122 family)